VVARAVEHVIVRQTEPDTTHDLLDRHAERFSRGTGIVELRLQRRDVAVEETRLTLTIWPSRTTSTLSRGSARRAPSRTRTARVVVVVTRFHHTASSAPRGDLTSECAPRREAMPRR
jgi:hypothetical protein